MRKLVCFIQYIFSIVSVEPERLFENLKKRFSKRRTAVKKAKRSGAGRIDVQKAEEELNKYAFLEWIIPFIAVKDSISNLDVTSGIGGWVLVSMSDLKQMMSLKKKSKMKVTMEKTLTEMTMTKKLKSKLPKERGKLKLRM